MSSNYHARIMNMIQDFDWRGTLAERDTRHAAAKIAAEADAEIERLTRELAEAREALRPFADLNNAHVDIVYMASSAVLLPVTAGDVGRARGVLARLEEKE